MHRVVLASVVVLSAATAACSNVQGASPSNEMSIVGPSNLARPTAATFAKGGNSGGNGQSNCNGNGAATDGTDDFDEFDEFDAAHQGRQAPGDDPPEAGARET